MKKLIYISFLVFALCPLLVEAQFYNRNIYRTQRNEISFGLGASSCLTDIGGGKSIDDSFFKDYARAFLFDINTDQTQYAFSFSYKYFLKSKLAFRVNLAYAKVAGDDQSTTDPSRANRNLNFQTTIIEGSTVLEWNIITEKTGNRYNLKNKYNKSIGARNLLGFGFYIFGGIGGFFFDPYGIDNISGAMVKHQLRPMRTEGQGLLSPNDPFYSKLENAAGLDVDYSKYAFEEGDSYKPFAICAPVGFGIRKSFHSMAGIKLEAGFRFTNTDYIDDVSTRYFDPFLLEQQRGKDAVTMSGVNSGNTYVSYIRYGYSGPPPVGSDAALSAGIADHSPAGPDITSSLGEGFTEVYFWNSSPGQIRGNPTNLDSYMFLTLSAYKKFRNTQKSFKVANSGFKRKIKASF